jgi:DHA1 family bicyclomycin/chloramphenicol resistance-like MFS transporter
LIGKLPGVGGVSRPAGRSVASLAVVLGALTAFGPVSVDLYLPAFPALARHFDSSVGTVQLSLSTYMVGLAIGQLVYGRLADIYGRRRPLLWGIALYVAVSIACAYAPSVGALIGLRAVQGFAGCAGMVISRAIVRDLYAGAEAARFFSLLMLVFGIAPIVAPLLGGQILALGGWQGVFLALAAYGVACFALAAWLPETLPPERRRAAGVHDALASYRQVLHSRTFVAYATASACAGAALIAYIAASPAVVIDQFGVSPQLFGLVFGVNSLGLVIASQITARTVRRLGPATVLRWAITLEAAGGGALLAVALAGGGLWAALVPMFVVVASFGGVMPTSAALALTPFPETAGAASALFGGAQSVLAALGGVLVSGIRLEAATSMGIVIAGMSLLSLFVLLRLAPDWRADVPETVPESASLG